MKQISQIQTYYITAFNPQQKDPEDFKLALSAAEAVFFFAPDEKLYCVGENNYNRFIFTKNKPMLVSKTLGGFQRLTAKELYNRASRNMHSVDKTQRAVRNVFLCRYI